MGYIRHHIACIVVRDSSKSQIENWRSFLPEDQRHLVVGPIDGVNGYVSYAFMPDGSKEGWEPSDLADEYRQQFLQLGATDAVSVAFGGDGDGAYVDYDGNPTEKT